MVSAINSSALSVSGSASTSNASQIAALEKQLVGLQTQLIKAETNVTSENVIVDLIDIIDTTTQNSAIKWRVN